MADIAVDKQAGDSGSNTDRTATSWNAMAQTDYVDTTFVLQNGSNKRVVRLPMAASYLGFDSADALAWVNAIDAATNARINEVKQTIFTNENPLDVPAGSITDYKCLIATYAVKYRDGRNENKSIFINFVADAQKYADLAVFIAAHSDDLFFGSETALVGSVLSKTFLGCTQGKMKLN